MSDFAVELYDVGKRYKLYRRPVDKFVDAMGLHWLPFHRPEEPQEFWAVRNLSFKVKKGERLGILGRNGAGKSTLLKLIFDTIPLTEGRIKVNGNIQALMELGTAFHPDFTGRENIKTSLSYHGFSAEEISELEEEIIASVANLMPWLFAEAPVPPPWPATVTPPPEDVMVAFVLAT